MNSLQVNEKIIYQDLHSLFAKHGYQASPESKQFKKTTNNGSRSVLFQLRSAADGHVLEVQLGLRFEMVENLVYQFIDAPKESNTIALSLNWFRKETQPPLLVTDEASLKSNCKRVADFMQKKGFKALQRIHRLKKVDAVVNRRPHIACPYMKNEVYRCFKGITMARLLQRTDFEQLASFYRDYLDDQWAPEAVMGNYNSLVNYLRCFSFN